MYQTSLKTQASVKGYIVYSRYFYCHSAENAPPEPALRTIHTLFPNSGAAGLFNFNLEKSGRGIDLNRAY